MSASAVLAFVYAVVHLSVMARALTVSDREPASRAAWLLMLAFLPVVGIVAYFLLGEPWVAHRFRARANSLGIEPDAVSDPGELLAPDAVPERFRAAFMASEVLARSPATAGNIATLATDSDAAIDDMVRDFDAAGDTIYISFYIWLTDNNGLKVVDALCRAAARGVVCRVIADGVGSRSLIRSRHWTAMRQAGVKLCSSMKVSAGLAVLLGSRVDLRNHRKIVVVDDRITWCGSQNCADAAFLVKARYAPWVDVMYRFEGPVAVQNQHLFASSWIIETGEDIRSQADDDRGAPIPGGFVAVAFGTGPMSPKGAMSDIFVSLLYGARREVVISTPYFVPDPPLLGALAACARRGVRTCLILPACNDSLTVAAISKAHYQQLAEAGVSIHEFHGGLLHAKTLVADRIVTLIGSANMDRRSLDLNFENNILLCSPEISDITRARQDSYLAASTPITAESVRDRHLLRRITENAATILGPIM